MPPTKTPMVASGMSVSSRARRRKRRVGSCTCGERERVLSVSECVCAGSPFVAASRGLHGLHVDPPPTRRRGRHTHPYDAAAPVVRQVGQVDCDDDAENIDHRRRGRVRDRVEHQLAVQRRRRPHDSSRVRLSLGVVALAGRLEATEGFRVSDDGGGF